MNEVKHNIYQQNGFDTREDYLNDLADTYGLDVEIVTMVADLLGPNEDFDGLVSELEDASWLMGPV